MFAMLLPVLMLFAGGAVDFTRYYAARADMIESMDAAGLAMAQMDALNGPEIRDLSGAAREAYLKEQGRKFFYENFRHASIVEDLGVDFDLTASTITPRVTGRIKTLFLGIGQKLVNGPGGGDGLSYLTLASETEIVRRDDGNIELAMVMDITGSMSGSRIADLKDAAKEMVDIVVREDQSEWYSKAAIVPYSMGVNVGAYADDVRGEIPPSISIEEIDRLGRNRVMITAPGHGFSAGDRVHLTNLGWPNGSGWVANLDERTYGVANVTANTFELAGTGRIGRSGSYTSGGQAWCVEEGCEYFAFTSATNSERTFRITTCVSERVGSQIYTDASPSTAPVGRVYKDSSNTCPEATIMPLSTDKAALKDAIDSFEAAGSTAGQIGIAWGWYLLSPNFGNLFSAQSQPAPYSDDETTKAAVIMTDGEFNTPYCKGVIARDARSGSGSASDHINCAATNGDPYDQSESMCDAMKNAGVIVYTIGFDISSSTDVTDLLTNCATGPDYVYFAATGDELKQIYRDIGSEITKLHIGK